jgi:hypothetical protein
MTARLISACALPVPRNNRRGVTEDVVLKNHEGKLDGGSSEPHRFRGSALAHAVQRVLI